MTNRVDELESQVDELQATVNGLTEQLVEANERIRLLEESVDVDLTSGTRSVGHDPDITAEGRDDGTADSSPEADEAAVATGGGSDPLAESHAQTASRNRTSDAPSDDASFVDASSGDAAGSDPTRSGAAPDADGTKSDGADDTDEAATEDDDIIVA